jgi:SAM-dependent methyltransferase
MSNGWDESVDAWIAAMGSRGDYTREHVLDTPMMARVSGRGFGFALDVGCGEGRFCRMMQDCGIRTVGIDPTAALIGYARSLDPDGDYRIGRAEALEFPDDGWQRSADGEIRYCIDHYLEERSEWLAWRGIRILNWHRPLSRYMSLLLAQGMILRHFDEPPPLGGDPEKVARYRRIPYALLMEWEKPGT